MLERSLLGLQRYVCAYACKGAATTEDLIKVYKMLLETSGESANVRSLAQRLLLKTVGMVDVPAAAADLMLSGGKLCRSTRHIHRVGLSGYRSLKKKAGADGVATNDNPLDRFLGRKIPLGLDAVYVSKMSLWEWATECANVKNCSCGRPHAPFFTGKPMLPSWPPTEEYALGQLMIHAQGTWRKIDELKWAQADGSVAVPGTLLPDGSLAAGADTFVDAFLKCFGLDGAPETLQAPGHVGGPTEDLEERGFPRRAQMVRELTLASKEKSERAARLVEKRAQAKAAREQAAREGRQLESDGEEEEEEDDDDERTPGAYNNLAAAALLRTSASTGDAVDGDVEEEPLPGLADGDWHEHAQASFGGVWPDDASTWLESLAARVQQEDAAGGAAAADAALPNVPGESAAVTSRHVTSVSVAAMSRQRV